MRCRDERHAAIADDLARWVAAGPFHPPFRAHENAEAQFAIHAAAWFSHEHLADTGNVRMTGGRSGQERSQAAAPMGGIDEHIAEPGESGAVGDQPGEASLNIVSGIKPQRQRLLDRACHHLIRPARSPVTFAADPGVYPMHVNL